MYYSEDGCVMLHDARAERRITRAQATLQQAAEFSGAFFHPRMEHLFATFVFAIRVWHLDRYISERRRVSSTRLPRLIRGA